MARNLENAPGIVIDSDYLKGKIKNGETLVGEHIYQDIVQFFQKLVDNAGITPSGNPDNEVNGYQFISALNTHIFNEYISDLVNDKKDKVDFIDKTLFYDDHNNVKIYYGAIKIGNSYMVTVEFDLPEGIGLSGSSATDLPEKYRPNSSIKNAWCNEDDEGATERRYCVVFSDGGVECYNDYGLAAGSISVTYLT